MDNCSRVQVWKSALRTSASLLIILMGLNLQILPAAHAADTAQGEKIFRFKCLKCHGPSGKGDGPMAKGFPSPLPDFSAAGFFDSRSDADLKKVILNGKSLMPAFQEDVASGRLSETDIDHLIAYIKTFAKRGAN